MNVIEAPSPNFDDRGRSIDMIVLHYTGMQTGHEALARLRSTDAKVSAHYLVEENGDIYRLVAEESRAWHAGVAVWRGEADINARSVGIEIVNPGHEWGYRAFPDAQIASVVLLTKEIVARHGVKPENVVGHSDVAPRRKEDPGELFPWDRFADEGLALAPFAGEPDDGRSVSYETALGALRAIGYDAPARRPRGSFIGVSATLLPAIAGVRL